MSLEIKKNVPSGENPEGTVQFKKQTVVVLEDGEEPEAPPNFTPDELENTSAEPPHVILTGAQAYAEAREEKGD